MLSVARGPTLPAGLMGVRRGGGPGDGPGGTGCQCVRDGSRRLDDWASSDVKSGWAAVLCPLVTVGGWEPCQGWLSRQGEEREVSVRQDDSCRHRVQGCVTPGGAGLSPWEGPSQGSHQGEDGGPERDTSPRDPPGRGPPGRERLTVHSLSRPQYFTEWCP